MVYANEGKDVASMEWAARNILRRDWPTGNQDLHGEAQSKLKELLGGLQKDNRHDEAERMVNHVLQSKARDLVVLVKWQGAADIDLEVDEPIGTHCSFLQRQSPGGGVLIADRVGDTPQQSYVASKAFSGDYRLTLRRIWGRPLGGKAVVEVIQHQGTPDETHHRDTVIFDRIYMMNFNLADGSRTTAEFVPPVPPAPPAKQNALASSSQVLNNLRALADGDHTRIETSMQSDHMSAGNLQPQTPSLAAGTRAESGLIYQTKVAPIAQTGVDVIAQVSLDPDGNNMHVKLSPVFQGVQAQSAKVGMNNPLIPGVFEPGQQ